MKRGWPERWRQPGLWSLLLAPLSWAYRLGWHLDQAWKGLRSPQSVPGLKVTVIVVWPDEVEDELM